MSWREYPAEPHELLEGNLKDTLSADFLSGLTNGGY